MKSVIFIGAGISGLSAAFYYRKKHPGQSITILEKNETPGGNFSSSVIDGFTFESGPRGVMRNGHAFFHLLNESNGWHLLKPGRKTSSTRFIWYRNQLNQLGGNPFKTLFSPAMKGVIRSVLRERNLKNSCSEPDESLESFFRRRFGNQITDVLLDAFVSGVYAGDISRLSVRSSFPSLWEAERNHGSVIRGLRAGKEQAKAKRQAELADFPHPETGKSRFYSTHGGIQQLAHHLAGFFRNELKTGAEVVSLQKEDRWKVTLASGEVLLADEVVLSTPASVTARILSETDPELAAQLMKIPYVPVAAVNLGYRLDPGHQAGFGFLIPKIEKKQILGIIFNSGTFDGVAPDGHVNYTVMIGGAGRPETAGLSREDLLETAKTAMKEFLGIDLQPVVSTVRVWPDAIPQYEVGHYRIVEDILRSGSAHQGLHLLGNWKNGIGVNDCIKSSFYWVKSLPE